VSCRKLQGGDAVVGVEHGVSPVSYTHLFDGQSFKAPELPKKQPKPKKAAPEIVEVPKAEAKATASAKKKTAAKKPAAKKAAPKKKK